MYPNEFNIPPYLKPLPIGDALPSPLEEDASIWTDDPELRPHMDTPWLRAYASAHLGVDLPRPQANPTSQSSLDYNGLPLPGAVIPGRLLMVPATALACHTCIFGAIGSGKSQLALRMLALQMASGCSVIAIDPKADTLAHLIHYARHAGLSPDQIVVLSAADISRGVPGWNPLLTNLPAAQAADDLVSTLEHIYKSSWGPRLSHILVNALTLLASHGLSLYELPRLLKRPDYRAGLLRLPLPTGPRIDKAALREAHDFFAHDFSHWSRSDQNVAVGPVLNKISGLIRSDFFQALFCARRNTLDFSSLWHRQGVVLVHLDSTTLGDEGARILGGLLTHHLKRMSMRSPGPIPVVLALDEMASQEQRFGSALLEIVTMARSQNLRLLVATQHIGGMSHELREALLNNAGVKVFFRLGPSDARPVASNFAVGAPTPLSRSTARVASRDHQTGLPVRTEWRHLVLDNHERPLRLDSSVWYAYKSECLSAFSGSNYPLRGISYLCASSGYPYLYVKSADTDETVPLSEYVSGLSDAEYSFDGPLPLELVVSFPRPQFSHTQQRSEGDLTSAWTRTLMSLPRQTAALRIENREPCLFEVPSMSLHQNTPELFGWWRASARRTCQHPREIELTAVWRTEQIELLSQGRLPHALDSTQSPRALTTREPERRAQSQGSGQRALPHPSDRSAQRHPKPSPPPRTPPPSKIGEDGSLE